MVNEVDDLKGIDKVAWKFILFIYKSKYDFLIVDNNIFFRKKKFTPKIKKVNTSKNKGSKSSNSLATLNRLLPPILAKLSEKVNKISKYFSKKQQFKERKKTRKLYTQASTSTNSTRKVLKIKKTF